MRLFFRRARRLAGAVALAFVCLTALAAAQSGVPPSTIAILVIPNRVEFWLGEPMVLTVRIYNWAIPSMHAFGSYGLPGATDVRIVREGEVGERYRAHFEPGPTTANAVNLPYGKACEFRMIVEYDPDNASHLAFDRAGVYQLQVEQPIEVTNLDNPAQYRVPLRLKARTTDLRFVEPPADGAGAWKLLCSYPESFRDLNRLMASPGSREVFEKVAKEYPRSRYAPYCLHALGTLSLNLIAAIPAEAERAEGAYKEVIERYPDYPLRSEVRLHLGRVYYQTGRVNLGLDVAEGLLADSEDNLYRFRESDIMIPFRGATDNPYKSVNVTSWQLFGTTQLPDTYAQLQLEQLR